MEVEKSSLVWWGQLGGIPDADGSAICKGCRGATGEGGAEWEMRAAVHGPTTVRSKDENGQGATITVTFDSFHGPLTIRHNSVAVRVGGWLQQVILTALHPRSQILIAIQPIKLPMSLSGSTDSEEWNFEEQAVAAFNTAILALLDAAIPMLAVPVAVLSGGLLTIHLYQSNSCKLMYQSWVEGTPISFDRLNELLQSNEQQSKQILDNNIHRILKEFYQPSTTK